MKEIAQTLIAHHSFSLSKTKALKICIAITFGVMALELIVGHLTRSLMLYSDGLHMLSHSASLLISLLAILWAKQSGNEQIETRAALINGVGLLVFTGYILWEAVVRLLAPEHIAIEDVYAVAFLGLLVNLLTAVILGASGVEDLNTRSAFLHMLADTFSSVAILVGAFFIQQFQWFWLDAILSAVIAFVVGKWAVGLIRSALRSLRLKTVVE